ncbi:hypothetical protein PINS_up002243 [Pythium insidiosum]|nr:hypothetical protein PINS_up002243 [Pythium insidiosum]
MTTDHDFIIDRIPLGAGSTNYKELVVGAGFSGHGAKMTPVIGKMLVDMAFGREDPTALEKFRLARFLD